jgi:hypothetical protein
MSRRCHFEGKNNRPCKQKYLQPLVQVSNSTRIAHPGFATLGGIARNPLNRTPRAHAYMGRALFRAQGMRDPPCVFNDAVNLHLLRYSNRCRWVRAIYNFKFPATPVQNCLVQDRKVQYVGGQQPLESECT